MDMILLAETETAARIVSWTDWLIAGAIFLGGILLAGVLSKVTGSFLKRQTGEHIENIVRKVVFWSLCLMVLFLTLDNLGIDITAVVTAAGIFGIAIGFAAQTSFSNMISGIFLLFEQPFKIGDAIQVGETMGVVLSIDLLSVKLRQFDNQFTRVPNETFLKNNITNLTKYDIRRFDIIVGIAYREDIAEAKEVVEGVVEEHPEVLKKPEPMVLVDQLADSSVNLRVRVWFDLKVFVKARSDLILQMKKALDEAGIEIPYPHRMHYASDDLLEAFGGTPGGPDVQEELSPEEEKKT